METLKKYATYFPLIFELAKAQIHGSKNPVQNASVIACLRSLNKPEIVMEVLRTLEESKASEEKSGDFTKLIKGFQTKQCKAQLQERQEKSKAPEKREIVKAADLKAFLKSRTAGEKPPGDEDIFQNIFQRLFCLDDFFCCNYDRVIENTDVPDLQWISFNSYVVMAEHYYGQQLMDKRLDYVRPPTESKLPPSLNEIELDQIISLQNLIRDYSNLSDKGDEQKKAQLYTELIELKLEKLCRHIDEVDQAPAKEFIHNILKLVSVASGFDFMEKFDSVCGDEKCLHCQNKHISKPLDRMAEHIARAMSKAIDQDKHVMPQSKQEKLFDELIPDLIGIKILENAPNTDKSVKNWTIPHETDDYDEDEENGDNGSETMSQTSAALSSPTKILKRSGTFSAYSIPQTIVLHKFDDFKSIVFQLLQLISNNFSYSILDDKMLDDDMKKLFKILADAFTKINMIKPHGSKSENSIPEFSKMVAALFKLKNGDTKDLHYLIKFTVNDQDRAKSVAAMITDKSKKIDVTKLKSLTTIHAKAESSDKTEDLKTVLSKIATGTASEKDLFKLCDRMGDGNGRIGCREFCVLAKRLGTPISEHRALEIYSKIKGMGVEMEDLELTEEEFSDALAFLKMKQVVQAMNQLGISADVLLAQLLYLLFLLIVLFIFLFLGIKAFTVGGAFSAVINSILPMGGGAALGNKDKSSEPIHDDKVAKATKTSMAIVHASADNDDHHDDAADKK
jgi:hypothetical protein